MGGSNCILSRKSVPQGPFGRIKLYFELENRPAGAFWADRIVFRAGKASQCHIFRFDSDALSQMVAGPASSHPRTGGGTSAPLIPEVRGTRGSLPERTSQPDDPSGVGGLHSDVMLATKTNRALLRWALDATKWVQLTPSQFGATKNSTIVEQFGVPR